MRALLLFAALTAAYAQGTAVLGPNALDQFKLRGAPHGVTVAVTGGEGDAFEKFLRIEVLARGYKAADVRVAAPIPAALHAGDVLLVRFSTRAGVARWDANFSVALEPGDTPWSKPLDMPIEASWSWRKIEIPFAIRHDYEPGKAELVFYAGQQIQTLDLAAIELINYGSTRKISELPATRFRYAGSDPGAAWRKAAGERIEQIRKAGLVVIVKDAGGKPVRGAGVSVKMRKHAFGFGTAVNAALAVSPAGEEYRRKIVELFNKAVIENHLKWPLWVNPSQQRVAIEAVDWLNQAGLTVRGHCLVWPSWRWTPVREAERVKNDPPSLAKVIRDHIADEAGKMRGKLAEWDVINEPYSNHDFMDILGKQAMVEWFQAARDADPGAMLYLNDYDILANNDTRHQDHYYATLEYLIAQGAPIEGIGLQGHFPARLTPPEQVLERLDRFAKLGKPLQITEFDVDTNDEETQAEYTRDILTALFSHPAAHGFLMWGFWEGSHWKPKCAMYRKDWSEKPNARAYRDLVFHQWWTTASGKTGKDGAWSVRGFLGEYDIEVQAAGKVRRLKAALPKQGATIQAVLD